MITTCRRHVPLGWIIIACLPVVAIRYSESAAGGSFVFTLKKFIDNPALLTLILSIPAFLSFVTSPLTSFMSDRVWTRFGRRMPFLMVSWVGMAACFVLMPVMPNIWLVAGLYILFDLFRSMYAPFEPLRNEIVPPHQRVRSATLMEWFGSVTQTLFWFVIFGRFDDVTFVSGFPVTGEEGMYWAGALVLITVTTAMIIGVREAEPHGDSRGERLSVRNLVKGLGDRELWPVYMLVFSAALLNAGLGPLGVLVYTETFGFTKQDQGTNVVVGGLINMCIIGVLGWWAERMDRIRAYQLLLAFSLVLKMAYYLYIEFVLPDQRATVIEAIVFGEVLSIVMLLKNMIYYPLAYDYVVRNKMGTFQAGSEMIKRLTSIVTVNMVGLFVTFYSGIFMPPAGEMTRIVLRDPVDHQAVEGALVERAGLSAGMLDIRPYKASGFTDDLNRAWEIRLDQPAAKAAASEREMLVADQRSLQAKAAGDAGARAGLEAVTARIAAIDADLAAKSQEFAATVHVAFGDRLMEEGAGIRAAAGMPARLIAFVPARHVAAGTLERVLDQVRRTHPAAVDLRVETGEDGKRLWLGVVEDGADDAEWGRRLDVIMAVHAPGALRSAVPERVLASRAVRLELQTVEEPREDRPSPITTVVNWVLSWFGADPSPERRINALARNLRQVDTTPQVAARRGDGVERTVVVTAIVRPGQALPPAGDGAVDRRIRELGAPGDLVGLTARLHDRAVPAAAGLRLTVARPVITTAFAPMKYDYMSGYLMMFGLGLIGLWLTFEFCRRERNGQISKRGLEEEKELS